MDGLNSVLLEGNLIADPTTKKGDSGFAICEFTVEHIRTIKIGDQYKVKKSHYDIFTTNRLANTCSEYLKKGRGVRVVGRLNQSNEVDENGKDQSKVWIVAEHVEFKPVKRGEV